MGSFLDQTSDSLSDSCASLFFHLNNLCSEISQYTLLINFELYFDQWKFKTSSTSQLMNSDWNFFSPVQHWAANEDALQMRLWSKKLENSFDKKWKTILKITYKISARLCLGLSQCFKAFKLYSLVWFAKLLTTNKIGNILMHSSSFHIDNLSIKFI